tara:strand:- start:16702 stop:17103 length:402 start_codon:yes stop_codon:yes gene_type:complete
MNKSDLLTQPPNFLKILGNTSHSYNIKEGYLEMEFDLSDDFAHTFGTIIQGGFITAMLDASMGHIIMRANDGKMNSATLSLNVNFLAPGRPGQFKAVGRIDKQGKNIAFTNSQLFQEEQLIATATASLKLMQL